VLGAAGLRSPAQQGPLHPHRASLYLRALPCLRRGNHLGDCFSLLFLCRVPNLECRPCQLSPARIEAQRSDFVEIAPKPQQPHYVVRAGIVTFTSPGIVGTCPSKRRRSSCAKLSRTSAIGLRIQPILILRGLASSTLGSTSVNTPSFISALIFPCSILFDSEKLRR
jgi:hypothetical protein